MAAACSDVLNTGHNILLRSYIVYSWKHRATLVFGGRVVNRSVPTSTHITEIITDKGLITGVRHDLVLDLRGFWSWFCIALDDVGRYEGSCTCLTTIAREDLLESLALPPFPDHKHDLENEDDKANNQGSNSTSVSRFVTFSVCLCVIPCNLELSVKLPDICES